MSEPGKVCTPEDPFDPVKDAGRRVEHPSAVDDGECNEGCCDCYRCPVCGHSWREELPQ